MTEKLKPCPFCDGEAIGFEWSDDEEREEGELHADDAYCAVKANHKDDCLLKVGEFGMWIASTEEEAAEIWNTRAERKCHMKRRPATFPGSIGYLTCSFCDCGFDYTEEPFNCMNCGAKVVD